MGMFDTVYNNFVELGEDFSGPLQTKDLYGVMATFWISPAGELFEYDEEGCWDYEQKEDKDEQPFGFNYVWSKKPTGRHIKLKPMSFSNYIVVYPNKPFYGSWEDSPVARLHIRDGKIESYKVTTQGDNTWQV